MAVIHPFAYHNGTVLPSQEVRLSPFQTGLLTGWGLFSTLRIYQGVPFALEDHWARLASDGQRLHVDLGGMEEYMRDGFAQLIAKNGAQEAMARVYFIRNRGGLLDVAGQAATDILMFTANLRDWGASARLRLQPTARQAMHPLAGTKTLTWAHNLVLLEEATQAGYDDVLLLNERGEVAECTAANVFAVKKRLLLTPPIEESGALAGVSRKHILKACARHGIPVEVRSLRPDDLFTADEVFISSSTREVQPVHEIDGHAIPFGPMSQKIETIFQQEVQEYVAARMAGR